MSEPSNIRTKSIDQVNEQYTRLRSTLEREINKARKAGDTERAIQLAGRGMRLGYTRQRYVNNMKTSTAMQRAMAGMSGEERDMFTSSFGAANDVQVPVRQYRKNNR